MKQPCGACPPGARCPATRLIPATDNRDDRSPIGDIPDRSSPSPSSASGGPRHRRDPSPQGIGEATQPVVLEPDAEVGQGWEGGKTPPFRVNSRQTSRDLSVTCPVSGLNLARRVSVWLDFARWALVSAARRGRPQERFSLVFLGVRVGSARRAFADLENRQRRKSFVGSNPTPSALFSRVKRGSPPREGVGTLAKTPVTLTECRCGVAHSPAASRELPGLVPSATEIEARGNASKTSAASFREHPMRGSKSGNVRP